MKGMKLWESVEHTHCFFCKFVFNYRRGGTLAVVCGWASFPVESGSYG